MKLTEAINVLREKGIAQLFGFEKDTDINAIFDNALSIENDKRHYEENLHSYALKEINGISFIVFEFDEDIPIYFSVPKTEAMEVWTGKKIAKAETKEIMCTQRKHVDFECFDKDKVIHNVRYLCKTKGIVPTTACMESRAGKSFISDINGGMVPSVGKIQSLASYLGVTSSMLLGEDQIYREVDSEIPSKYAGVTDSLLQLNPTNLQEAIDFIDYLLDKQTRLKRIYGKIMDLTNGTKSESGNVESGEVGV